MKKMLIATILALTASTGYCATVSLQPGKSLMEQTRNLASVRGYVVIWKLPVDDLAQSAAHQYNSWEEAIYGATRQLSNVTLADANIADLAAPVVCETSKTIVITNLNDARSIVRDDQSHTCRALHTD